MNDDLPEAIRDKRAQLLEEIYRVFGEADRVGGVSWSEARVVDDNGTDEERAAARSRDTETGWRELIDDESWIPDTNVDRWNFLDPIGFRYYLPAVIVRCVRTGEDEGIDNHLDLPRSSFRGYTFDKWSALDAEQRVCVKHFLEFMATVSEYSAREVRGWRSWAWRRTLSSYWESVDG